MHFSKSDRVKSQNFIDCFYCKLNLVDISTPHVNDSRGRDSKKRSSSYREIKQRNNQTQILRSVHSLTQDVSKMAADTAIVTIEGF